MYILRVEFTYTPYNDYAEMRRDEKQARDSGMATAIFVNWDEHERLLLLAGVAPAPVSQLIGGKLTALDQAKEIIYGEREKTYGHPAKNLQKIAALWSSYLDDMPKFPKLAAQDVAQMMVLLKLARLQNQPSHKDSIVDLIGYAALVDRLHEGA